MIGPSLALVVFIVLTVLMGYWLGRISEKTPTHPTVALSVRVTFIVLLVCTLLLVFRSARQLLSGL